MIRFPKRPADLDPSVAQYLKDLESVLHKELDARTPDLKPTGAVLVSSPDTSIWSITVDDAGTIAATKVFDGS